MHTTRGERQLCIIAHSRLVPGTITMMRTKLPDAQCLCVKAWCACALCVRHPIYSGRQFQVLLLSTFDPNKIRVYRKTESVCLNSIVSQRVPVCYDLVLLYRYGDRCCLAPRQSWAGEVQCDTFVPSSFEVQ